MMHKLAQGIGRVTHTALGHSVICSVRREQCSVAGAVAGMQLLDHRPREAVAVRVAGSEAMEALGAAVAQHATVGSTVLLSGYITIHKHTPIERHLSSLLRRCWLVCNHLG